MHENPTHHRKPHNSGDTENRETAGTGIRRGRTPASPYRHHSHVVVGLACLNVCLNEWTLLASTLIDQGDLLLSL